jgi:hypothetical protein
MLDGRLEEGRGGVGGAKVVPDHNFVLGNHPDKVRLDL